MTTLTKTQFAHHIGKSPSYITKLKDEGRLVLEGNRVRVAESIARIAATAGGREDVAARHAEARGESQPAPGGTHAAASTAKGAAAADPGKAESRVETKAMATSRKESAQADIAEMERDEKRGSLIPKEDVDAAFKFVGGALSGLLDNLPGQQAAVLAPINDPDAMEVALRDMCHRLVTQFGEAIKRQQDALAERKS